MAGVGRETDFDMAVVRKQAGVVGKVAAGTVQEQELARIAAVGCRACSMEVH